jgi:peptidyl-prolyl cis-trans isomerase A (cyclophilin A)
MGDDDVYYDADGEEKVIVECGTTAGAFAMEFNKDWSPLGFERAIELFDRGFYDHSHFFRVVPGFLVQFGISYTEDIELRQLGQKQFKDDPPLKPKKEFEEGMISFAGSGENSRTSHLFISYGRNPNLGTQLWETPVGTVIRGMDVIRNLNHEYGDMPPWGKGPEQHKINARGKAYIEEEFPHLDKFLTCHVLRPPPSEEEEEELALLGHTPDDEDKDDATNAEKELLEAGGGVKSLRKTVQHIGTVSSSQGFEVPIMIAVGVLIIIIIGVRRRSMVNHSKSL